MKKLSISEMMKAIPPKPEPVTFKINPELKDVEKVVKFLGFLQLTFSDKTQVPADIKTLLDEGIVIIPGAIIKP
jgi:hypothetical protein